MKRVLALDPAAFTRHAIHGEGRIWAETNCYVDVWIELLHALGHQPVASLPFTFGIDFEGDQWTFFKCPLSDLRTLYGVDVQELAIWRPLAAHVEEQVGRGCPVLVELDSYYLPDTAGTAYRRVHWKTTVAVAEIDVARRHMGYFHAQGYHHVHGEDFAGALRLDEPDPARLAPYVEFVKIRAAPANGKSLVERSLSLFADHLALAPVDNPFGRFRTQLERDLSWLVQAGLDDFHSYSFATLRQYGACFELSATYLEWLSAEGEKYLDREIEDLAALSQTAKTFQFQLARAISRRRPLDLGPLVSMGERWERAIRSLQSRYAMRDSRERRMKAGE